MDGKRQEFDRLWNANSKHKRDQFQNLMRAKLEQIRVPFTEDNARGYYLGQVRAAPLREQYRESRPEPRPFRSRRRPRRR